ncbi:MAG: tetratricopeptide repeat protein, partial [Richelia sp. RM2_1_2]|nr:tetratricopeptide repeat protein [Richelia sp. RM2_1_2]
MSTQFSPQKFYSLQLLSWSITVAMTLGLLVNIPKPVTGQTQPTQSNQQSPELQEAERLNQQVVKLYQEGKYAEAIPLAEKALAIREKVLGKEHPDVATSLNNLAGLYESQGNYSSSEPLYLRSLAIREKFSVKN